MFAKGAFKIYRSLNKDHKLIEVEELAVKSGYHALTFDGDIYVRLTKKGWIKTVFRYSDFLVASL